MIEYPSIDGPAKAPRSLCTAFEKIDGSNIRVKYQHKQGFTIFGSRREYIDAKHPHLGQVIEVFNRTHAPTLTEIFKKEFPNEKEITVFGEFYGPNSIGGIHDIEDMKNFTMFDVMLVKKGINEFIKPSEFIKLFHGRVDIPRVVYIGNLNEEFIRDVQNGLYVLNEGVVCKGHVTSGAYRGKVWMTKIKTFDYLQKLKEHYGQEWEKYA